MKTEVWKYTQFSLLEFDVLYNYIQIIFCLSLVEFFILNDGIHKLNISKMCFPKRKIGENWLIMTYYTVLDVIVERYGKSEHTQQWRLGADQFIAFQSIWLLFFFFFFEATMSTMFSCALAPMNLSLFEILRAVRWSPGAWSQLLTDPALLLPAEEASAPLPVPKRCSGIFWWKQTNSA